MDNSLRKATDADAAVLNTAVEAFGAIPTPVPLWSNDTLASMLAVWSDDHPVPRVRAAMLEAAKRLRGVIDPPPRYELTPKGRDALEGRE